MSMKYSDREWQLIDALNLRDVAESQSMTIPILYMTMAMQCFRENRNDVVSTSVRNCLRALDDGTTNDLAPHRLTPEYDALIVLPKGCQCYVDCDEPNWDGPILSCEIDTKGNGCRIANKLMSEHKTKWDCEHWRKQK